MSGRVIRKRAREDSATEGELSPVRKRSHSVEHRPQDQESVAGTGGEGDGAGLKKDEEFWREDGTVILVARDVEFRVYSGILASHSPVFRDMFAQDHPTRIVSMNGKFDMPCPVVQLSDSPEDLRHFLRVYMPSDDCNLYDAKEPSFDVISASIRLGHKYQALALYEQSLQYLGAHYTNDLLTWIDIDDWVPSLTWSYTEVIGVVNLARLIGEPTLVPTAILGCNVLADEIVRGFEREDGSREHLTLEDLGICFRAKSEIRKASIKMVLQSLHPVVSRECKLLTTCQRALRSALTSLHEHTDDLVDNDPFVSWRHFVDDEQERKLCDACLAMVDERNMSARRNLWNRLPEVLGIEVPGWVEPEPAVNQG